MNELRKITVEVPAATLESAQRFTGAGVSETVRIALRELAHRRASRELLALAGKVDLKIDLEELRKDRDEP